MKNRIFSVDLLRGLIIAIMALDHTRDFINSSALLFNPEDLSKTTHALFFTRWITHFCAPVFAFTAGTGAFLRLERGGTKAELSRFLWTRGLWLVFLEFTLVRLAFFFGLNYTDHPTFLLVFWMLGISMIALAALIHLPYRVLAGVSVATIVFHNLLDKITPAQFGSYSWIWNLIHQPGLVSPDPVVIVGYPLIPWIAVMSAGFCFGKVFRLPSEQRSKLLIRAGLALTAAFVLIRFVNLYGDPRPWAAEAAPGFTLISFLRVTKNPPSLDFLLMTLGPAIAFLGLVDRVQPKSSHPFIVFGRTPQFFFVVHFVAIHLFAIAMGYMRYGSQSFLWQPSPVIGGAPTYPTGYGWSLAITYAVWLAVVIIMYPLCLWLAKLKATRRDWWLSYL